MSTVIAIRIDEVRCRILSAMKEVDESGQYPTAARIAKLLPDIHERTLQRERNRALRLGDYVPVTQPAGDRRAISTRQLWWQVGRPEETKISEDNEPYSDNELTPDQVAEVEATRAKVFEDSILSFLGQRDGEYGLNGKSKVSDLREDNLDIMANVISDDEEPRSACQKIIKLFGSMAWPQRRKSTASAS